MQAPPGMERWSGPFLVKEAFHNDPWGRPYVYRCPGQHNNDFDLFSVGPDGKEGTGDAINNWSQRATTQQNGTAGSP
jgi:general secretion pathway protein G